MKTNSVIQSVREAREEISREFNHDVKKLIDYYKLKQESHLDRLIDVKKKMTDEEVGIKKRA